MHNTNRKRNITKCKPLDLVGQNMASKVIATLHPIVSRRAR